MGMPGDKLEIKFNKRRFGLRLHKRQKYEEDYIKSIYEFSPYPQIDSDEIRLIQKVLPNAARL